MLHLLFELGASAIVNATLPSIGIVMAACALMRFRSFGASTRYCIWWIALICVLALPFVTAMIQSREPARARTRVVVHLRRGETAEPTVHASAGLRAPVVRTQPDVVDIFACLCCGLAAMQLLRLVRSLFRALALKRAARRVDVLADTGLPRAIRIMTSDGVASAMAIGYLRPAILLTPLLLDRLDEHETDHVLRHEMAHIRRYDDWAIVVERLLSAVFAFHPLVHFICWRMDLDREMACDDHVLASAKASDYATSLTKVAELVRFPSAPALSLPVIAKKSSFSRRIETMLDKTRSHAPKFSLTRTVSFSVLAVLVAAAGTRIPTLFASPLVSDGDDIGPIVLTAPDGSASMFQHDGSEMRADSAFPAGTIVFKKHGKSYVIHDRSTMEAAKKLLQPMTELSQQQRSLADQQRALGEKQRAMGEQMRQVVQIKLDPEMQKRIDEEVRTVREKMQSPEMQRMVEESTKDAMQQLGEFQAQIGRLQAQLGRDLSKHLGEEQARIGAQMGKLGAEQGRLGAMQGKFGKQQAEQSQRIERELKQLIDKAQKQGLAQPLQ